MVYYTLDGTDPRLPGGEVSPHAIMYSGNIEINQTTQITSRSYNPDFNSNFSTKREPWSGPVSGLFEFTADPSDVLRIGEVHYNPAEPSEAEIVAGFDDKDDFEFLEITNVGATEVNLAGVELDETTVADDTEGVSFSFGEGAITRLGPGERLVVVEDIDAFRQRYGADTFVAGSWAGALNNGGETLTLSIDGRVIQQFRYDDAWHPSTDGGGFSLEIVDVAGDLAVWKTAEGWRASRQFGGTPGPEALPGDLNLDRKINAADIDLLYEQIHQPNPDRRFDLTGDDLVQQDDVDLLIGSILNTRLGDSDLDGDVDISDFESVASGFGSDGASWEQGDFDGDRKITFADFVFLANNFDLNM